jgi:hypothetical protein
MWHGATTIRRLARLAAVLLPGALACQPSGSGAPVDEAAPEVSEAERERLQSLGYVYFSREKATGDSGVVTLDVSRAQPGFTLVSVRYRCRAELIDLNGNLVHEWEHRPCRYWSTVELLEDGDLLVTGMDPPAEGRRVDFDAMYLMRLRWDGTVAWKKRIPAHHDAEVTPRDQILTLQSSLRTIPALDPEVQIEDELLTLLTPEGQVVEEASLFDIVRSAPHVLRLRRTRPRSRHEGPVMELFHANSVEWMRHPQLEERHAIYAGSNLLTCLRNQNVIAIIDWERKLLLWAWGRDELQLPHHPTLLDNGNILVFDNGVRRRWSRVIEIEPLSGEIVWEYRAPDPEDFFSASRGSNQRLANGNTLIADSDSGRAFEVTSDGEIVWDFRISYLNEQGHRATIERARRYDPSFIEGLIGGDAG